MAKGKYEKWLKKENLVLLEGWARDGLTDKEISGKMQISESTLYEYKKKYPEISESLKKGKEFIDYLVERKLLENCLSGDTTAIIYWLKNRKPDQWSERRGVKNNNDAELTGNNLGIFELPARMVAPSFIDVLLDIEEKAHTEYVLKGGRGGSKSSFIGLAIILLLKRMPKVHCVICRKVGNTLRDSVYAQILWAIGELGLENEFDTKVSPLQITYKPTGQVIFFRGADDPMKLKSIKVPFGYIGILWLEELDQFYGPEEVRSIEQSVVRGGDEAFIFKSFNPPKTKNNWANKYILIPKDNQLVHHSTYKTVPKKWLGKIFIDEADHIKKVNPQAYEHEYLGVPTGTGGAVFDNVTIKRITNDEIKVFDRIYRGIDWGWYPDPFTFNEMYYNASRRELYIYKELRFNKMPNQKAADEILKIGVNKEDRITADSAEEKSVQDFRSYGFNIRGAVKGPGSVDYSMKWLQSLGKIIIDDRRCPETTKEFLDYEYEKDKNGDVISGYPDKNNHHIDGVRYAMEEMWKRRGK